MRFYVKKEVLIERAVAVHGDKFDYSLVPDEFKSKDKLLITCKIHGAFEQTAHNHLYGKKCKRCADIDTSAARTNAAKGTFLDRALTIHGDSYDYSLFQWNGSQVKSKFICKTHGVFLQSPSNHLAGKGCDKCAMLKRKEKLSFSSDEFVAMAKQSHSDYYDYSLVNYINSQTKVVITCPIHGEFSQIPNSHLQGCGCPSCKKSGFSPSKSAIFYILKVTDNIIKFGITSNLETRVRNIRRKSNFDIIVLYQLTFTKGIIAKSLESEIKSLVEVSVISKELLPDGYTETTYSSNYAKLVDLSLTYKDQLS